MAKTAAKVATKSATIAANDADQTSVPATVSFQCLPLATLTKEELYAAVDRAIDVVAESGVAYQVGPMETTMEGDLDTLLDIVKRAHLACLESGVPRVFTNVKIGCGADTGTMDEKITPYRRQGH